MCYKCVLVQEVCETSIKTKITPVIVPRVCVCVVFFSFYFSLLLSIEHVQRFLDVTLISQDKFLLKVVDQMGSRLKSLIVVNTGRQHLSGKRFA